MKNHNINFRSVVFTLGLLRCVSRLPVTCVCVRACVCVCVCACVCVCVCIICIPSPRQHKFRAMNGALLASPVRGELGYAHRPQLGSQIYCPVGNKILGPIGKEDVCPNGWQICIQQFGQL